MGSSPSAAFHCSGLGPGLPPPLARAHVPLAWSVLSSGVQVSLGVRVSGEQGRVEGWWEPALPMVISGPAGGRAGVSPSTCPSFFPPGFPGAGGRTSVQGERRGGAVSDTYCPCFPSLPSRPRAPACEVSWPCLLTLLPWVPSEATVAPPHPSCR